MPFSIIHWERTSLGNSLPVFRILLFTIAFVSSSSGHPAKQNGVSVNVDDPNPEDAIKLENITLEGKQSSSSLNRNESSIRASTSENPKDSESKDDSVRSDEYLMKRISMLNLKKVFAEAGKSILSKVTCSTCRLVLAYLMNYVRKGKTAEDVINLAYKFCVTLRLKSPGVCNGLTKIFGHGYLDLMGIQFTILNSARRIRYEVHDNFDLTKYNFTVDDRSIS